MDDCILASVLKIEMRAAQGGVIDLVELGLVY